MLLLDQNAIVPLGASCINQFQIGFYFKQLVPERAFKGGLFDWTIATPNTTLQVLNHAKQGTLQELLCNKKLYVNELGRMRHMGFEGLYFWHENAFEIVWGTQERFEQFAQKVCHLVDNFLAATRTRSCLFLWSNVQPNLFEEMAARPLPWQTFVLTERFYESLKERVLQDFGASAQVCFITRRQDMEASLTSQADVFVMDVPRSEDYKGATDLYAPLFDKMLQLSS